MLEIVRRINCSCKKYSLHPYKPCTQENKVLYIGWTSSLHPCPKIYLVPRYMYKVEDLYLVTVPSTMCPGIRYHWLSAETKNSICPKISVSTVFLYSFLFIVFSKESM